MIVEWIQRISINNGTIKANNEVSLSGPPPFLPNSSTGYIVSVTGPKVERNLVRTFRIHYFLPSEWFLTVKFSVAEKLLAKKTFTKKQKVNVKRSHPPSNSITQSDMTWWPSGKRGQLSARVHCWLQEMVEIRNQILTEGHVSFADTVWSGEIIYSPCITRIFQWDKLLDDLFAVDVNECQF